MEEIYFNQNSTEDGRGFDSGEMDRDIIEDTINDSKCWEHSVITIQDLKIKYNGIGVLDGINMDIPEHRVTAIIGPSGSGKSTFLRAMNRMNDLIEDCKIEGKIYYDDMNIQKDDVDTSELRKEIGMVFQKPNPFPKSIYDNVAYGPRIGGIKDKEKLNEIVEKSLKNAALWEEVKDRLNSSALALSGGQQQRLCIARALAVEPNVILMDEPASALDPTAMSKIENLISNLKKDYTVVIVTHNMQQAERVSDFTAFLYGGEIVEFSRTSKIFKNPDEEMTKRYVNGRFG